MLGIIGTLPDPKFPLYHGPALLEDDVLVLGRERFPVNRGTAALVAAALKTAAFLGQEPPQVILAGDIGTGEGSRKVYDYLVHHLGEQHYTVLCFHYLLPEVDWHQLVFWAIEALRERPKLIADAGYMYVAKMSGLAAAYDLFTPDIGELAFLADEQAPHPFYTRGFLLQQEERVPELIARAYQHQNAAKYLLVKGATDYIVAAGRILATVTEPKIAALEAIGGTGDTLTGLVATLVAAGFEIGEAAWLAAKTNRLAGQLAEPTPATQVVELIQQLPAALTKLGVTPHHDRGQQLESTAS